MFKSKERAMSNPIHPVYPGPKKDADLEGYVAQQSQGSKACSYFELLPHEIKQEVAKHLTTRADLKNLSKISADWKCATLSVLNLQNEIAAIKELPALSNLRPSKPEQFSSALDVYKAFLLDMQDPVTLALYPRAQIDRNQLHKLQQRLQALSTSQVAERFRTLKEACYKDIKDGKASFKSIDDKYCALKRAFVYQAFQRVISCSIHPESLRGVAVSCAARYGHLELVRALLANRAQIAEEARGRAVVNAAFYGHLELVQTLLSNAATISLDHRGRAVANAAEKGHLEIAQCLLANGAQISEEQRGFAIRIGVKNRHLPVVHFLLATGSRQTSLEAMQFLFSHGVKISENLLRQP